MAGSCVLSLLLFLIRISPTQQESPPEGNDSCQSAFDVTSFPFDTSDSNVGAFPSFESSLCSLGVDDRGLWYKYSVSADQILRARVMNQMFSAKLAWFEGDDCGSLTCRSSTPDFRFVDQEITVTATAGTTVYFVVSGGTFEDAGTFQFTIEVRREVTLLQSMQCSRLYDYVSIRYSRLINFESRQALERPANDVCTGGTPLNSGDPIFDNNDAAFPSFSNLPCEVTSTERGLWYEYDPVESAVAIALVSDQEFDVRLSIYTGDCNALKCLGSEGPFGFIDVGLVFASYVGQPMQLLASGEEFVEAGNFVIGIQVSVFLLSYNTSSLAANNSHRYHFTNHPRPWNVQPTMCAWEQKA